MLKIGLTGGIGSGKSTVAKIFEMLGTLVFCSDVVAANLYFEKRVRQRIIEHFGNDILFDNVIDKVKLSNIIFNNPFELQWLNNLIHPLVKKNFDQWAKRKEKLGYEILFLESAIIFENNLEHWFDKIITVYAPEELAIERAVVRSNLLLREDIVLRMKNQIPPEKKCKFADFIIVNDGTKSVIEQVVKVWNEISGLNNNKFL